MSSYLDDPRDFPTQTEYLTSIEGSMKAYHWNANIITLDKMSAEEYMKPLTVIIAGFSGDTGTTVNKNVNIHVSLVNNGTDPCKVKFRWTGDFNNSIKAVAKANINNTEYIVSDILSDNQNKQKEVNVSNVPSGATGGTISYFGVGNPEASIEAITAQTYVVTSESEKVKYTFKISDNESIIYLTLKYFIDKVEKMSVNNIKFGDTIPAYSGSTAKEGFTFDGWATEDGTIYSATTMPSHNLNLYAKYSEASVTYYGTLLNNIFEGTQEQLDRLTSLSTSSFYDGQVVPYFVERDEFYVSKQNDEEWINNHEKEYQQTHLYYTALFVPKYIENTCSIFVTDGISEKNFSKTKDVTIDGKTYAMFSYNTPYMHASVEDQRWNFTITFIKNE